MDETTNTSPPDTKSGELATPEQLDDAAAEEVQPVVEDSESGVIASVEVDTSYWDTALDYVDYLHTDAVLLVFGVWLCAGIMLARILLDRVIR